MLAGTYEYHGEKDGSDITPGSHFTLEYGISQYLGQRLEVGIHGYIQHQIDEDRGGGLLDLSIKTEVSGFGAQLSYWVAPSLNLSLKYIKETDSMQGSRAIG